MGLPKGRTNNSKGRPVGTKNRVGRELRELMVSFVTTEIVNIRKKYSKLEPKDQLTFLTNLAPYAISKLSSVDMELRFENLTDAQLDILYSRVIDSMSQISGHHGGDQ